MEQVSSGRVAANYVRPWQRIAADLRTKIEAGRWQPGDRLPTISALMDEYGVGSKNTVRAAVALLHNEGLVETRGSSGIYVLEPKAVEQ